jgi:hypothetical protein
MRASAQKCARRRIRLSFAWVAEVAISIRDDSVRLQSKSLGLGFGAPITARLIISICDFYRAMATDPRSSRSLRRHFRQTGR